MPGNEATEVGSLVLELIFFLIFLACISAVIAGAVKTNKRVKQNDAMIKLLMHMAKMNGVPEHKISESVKEIHTLATVQQILK